jgi:hypothetical protein
MVLGLRVSYMPPLVGKKIKQFDHIEHNVDHHELGNCFKWEAVPGCPTSILHYPNSPFDIGYVLVGTCQIDHGATWHRLNQGLERQKIVVGVHRLDVKTTLEIILIHLFERFEYLRYRAIREMINCCEADLTTECQEERNLVDKEDYVVYNTSL